MLIISWIQIIINFELTNKIEVKNLLRLHCKLFIIYYIFSVLSYLIVQTFCQKTPLKIYIFYFLSIRILCRILRACMFLYNNFINILKLSEWGEPNHIEMTNVKYTNQQFMFDVWPQAYHQVGNGYKPIQRAYITHTHKSTNLLPMNEYPHIYYHRSKITKLVLMTARRTYPLYKHYKIWSDETAVRFSSNEHIGLIEHWNIYMLSAIHIYANSVNI